jgi:hypothetical protein
MFALAALVAFVIGAVLDWNHADHATLFLFIGLACIAAHLLAPVTPWKR